MPPLITIVMATYQGADYLPAQLDSILAQDHARWRLLVSDDGSRDDTCGIIQHYAARDPLQRISLIGGPGRGATANFLHLIRRADPEAWIAYCDQDDIWHRDKLSRAVAHLEQRREAAVYAARTTICDESMRILAPAPHFRGPFSFPNALIQACLPGNTTVANSAALRILQAGAEAADRAGIISHDWWTYQLLAGAGADIHRDEAQVLLYRQHGSNVMGRNDTASAKGARLSMLFDGSFAAWLAANHNALEGAAHLLLPENRERLEGFGRLIHAAGPEAAARMIALRLYRQNRSGTLAVLAAAFAGRLRKPSAPA
ncbi:glycosyltransferase family 2 protein [Paracoccus ravus]|uniref:glycosyltransferase family 2 protein n=1 Tax=Paracoccus ravus TaxID=2447760 RepID=UPI00106E5330|nr:glycosyltransferase family 2 protein [Paracoccus ravus]